MTAKDPLRVAIVVGSAIVPMWLERLVTRLRRSGCFEARLFTLESTPTQKRGSRLFHLYERVDAALFRGCPDAFAPVLLPPPDPQPLDELEGCDVVLDFASGDATALATLARYGAWVLAHSDRDGQPLEPPLFWETYHRSVYRIQLEAHLAGGDRRLLYGSCGATDVTSLQRARNQAYWKAQGAILNRLVAIAKQGRPYLESRPRAVAPQGERDQSPAATIIVRHAARAALGVIARRLRKTVYRDDWFIATRPYVRPATLEEVGSAGERPFAPITAPRGASFADPFLFEDGGRTYLFFEESRLGAGKGVISYVLLDDRARPVGVPAQVLVRPYHLSYPFVFRHKGEIFMIPESSENRTVELYRAVDFPSEWTLEDVLFRNVLAVDATLLEGSDRMWLFVTIAELGASLTEELHLYSSNRLSGPWEPHADNPVVSDVRSARPAGRIFRHQGNLIRPAQDCSRSYGFAVVFNRIDLLTPDEYRETQVARIEPTWLPRLSATHTYNFTHAVEVIDGRRPVLRPPFDRLAQLGRLW